MDIPATLPASNHGCAYENQNKTIIPVSNHAFSNENQREIMDYPTLPMSNHGFA